MPHWTKIRKLDQIAMQRSVGRLMCTEVGIGIVLEHLGDLVLGPVIKLAAVNRGDDPVPHVDQANET